jgi:hypothetical protein
VETLWNTQALSTDFRNNSACTLFSVTKMNEFYNKKAFSQGYNEIKTTEEIQYMTTKNK